MKVLEEINNKGICRASIDSNVINIVSQTVDTGATQATANRDIVVDIERSGAGEVHSSNEIPCAGAISTDTINNNKQIGGKPIDQIMIYSCGEIN